MAQDVLRQLKKIKEADARLSEAADLYSDLIVAQSAAKIGPVVTAPFDAAKVSERFSEGMPLLHAQEFALDWDRFSQLYEDVCEIGTRHRSDLEAEFAALQALKKREPDWIRNLAARFVDDGSVKQVNSTEDSGLPDQASHIELLDFVLTHALHPFLKRYADALKPLLEEQLGSDWEEGWQRGRCPLCGGLPDFAFIDDDGGNRHLVCSRCDSSWRFPRIKCAFCNTVEPSDLSYYPATDDAYRVYVCKRCNKYLKAVDRRHSLQRHSFAVERVLTIDLDFEAREQGYR